SKGATHGALWADYAFKLNENRSLFESTTGANSPRNAILPAIPEGEWVHVAVVYHDSMVTLYQNGISMTQPITAQSVIRVSDQPLYIGHRYEYNNAGRFQGLMDNLRIYNRALSEGEIEHLVLADCDRRVYLPLVVK
ncbi:MAG: LamG domain-containing protein, partial [Anaerolineae bacterium]